jgi:hypothetical protein
MREVLQRAGAGRFARGRALRLEAIGAAHSQEDDQSDEQ